MGTSANSSHSSWRSRLTVARMLLLRLTGPTANSSRKSESLKFSNSQNALTPSELPEVRELGVSSRDSELLASRDALTEVSVRSLVSELGIHLQSSGLLPVVVSWVTIQELSSTIRSIVLELVQLVVALTMLTARLMLLRRTSLHSVASPTTERLMKISF